MIFYLKRDKFIVLYKILSILKYDLHRHMSISTILKYSNYKILDFKSLQARNKLKLHS